MKDEALGVLASETGDKDFNVLDIQWVLTVPAIWTPRAKQFMREAAYEVTWLIPSVLYLLNQNLYISSIYNNLFTEVEVASGKYLPSPEATNHQLWSE